MSFHRVRRRMVEQVKPIPIPADGIILQWKDFPPSPCLSIYIGQKLIGELGHRSSAKPAILFIGRGEDAGKCGLRFVEGRDWDYRVQPHPRGGYKVHLPSHISVEHFTFCPRTLIAPEDIEIRGDLLIFAYAGIKA